MAEETNAEKVFELGICMAGAVSAGAYTAGAMDYLLEALDTWEQNRNKPGVPTHKVVIKVIGGASAGGMTSCITTLALFEGFKFVDKDNPQGAGNRLYD